jgi:hypothetical protein
MFQISETFEDRIRREILGYSSLLVTWNCRQPVVTQLRKKRQREHTQRVEESSSIGFASSSLMEINSLIDK